MLDSFYVILNCEVKDLKGTLSNHFNTPLVLKGKWEVALVHVIYDVGWKLLFTCDAVEYSYLDEKKIQFLSFYIPDEGGFYKNMYPLQYVSVNKKEIKDINIEIMKYPELSYFTSKEYYQKTNLKDLTCVLHFRKA